MKVELEFKKNFVATTSFYFGTTCQKENCKYFSLFYKDSNNLEDSWHQLSELFIVQSKNSGNNSIECLN